MGEEAESLTYRPYNGNDVPFLQNSWGNSYFRGTSAHKYLTAEEFHSYHRPIRERFFSKQNTAVIVCSPNDDPWLIIGWIAVEVIPSAVILQYLYVKSTYKGHGIAKELIKRAIPTKPVLYTHLTERAAIIISKKYEKFSDYKHVPHLV